MNLLLVYPYVPWPLNRGTYHRVFNLARELGRRHTVDLFCLDDSGSGEHRPVFQEFARRVHFQPFKKRALAEAFPEPAAELRAGDRAALDRSGGRHRAA